MNAVAPFDVKAFFAGREDVRYSFLNQTVGSSFTVTSLAEDWASRHYLRITRADGQSFVLLESVPDHIPTATLGHKLADFIKVASLLHRNGIHTPDIIAANEREGLVLLEDLGDLTLTAALDRGDDPMTLYSAATDVLIAMRDNISKDDLCDFPKYKDSYIRKRRQRVVDWYIPVTRGEKNSDDMLPSYLAAWDEVVAHLPPPPIGFLHGDFHAGNLMVLPDGTCGIVDFQDGMAGPLPFDLANLIEDIRRDIPQDVHDAMLNRYGADENFRNWFRVMAMQFHCSIIGQVLRLAIIGGKPHMLKYIPRMQNYIIQGLKDPIMKPMTDWFRAEKVDLAAQHGFDPEIAKKFIRSDAF